MVTHTRVLCAILDGLKPDRKAPAVDRHEYTLPRFHETQTGALSVVSSEEHI